MSRVFIIDDDRVADAIERLLEKKKRHDAMKRRMCTSSNVFECSCGNFTPSRPKQVINISCGNRYPSEYSVCGQTYGQSFGSCGGGLIGGCGGFTYRHGC